MDQAPDTASIKKKLETIAERDNVPICENLTAGNGRDPVG